MHWQLDDRLDRDCTCGRIDLGKFLTTADAKPLSVRWHTQGNCAVAEAHKLADLTEDVALHAHVCVSCQISVQLATDQICKFLQAGTMSGVVWPLD